MERHYNTIGSRSGRISLKPAARLTSNCEQASSRQVSEKKEKGKPAKGWLPALLAETAFHLLYPFPFHGY